ncbi:hypothetical protein CANARDRAFT_10144 [[Candida] arabinofermentans NRRL YB-2248]|uniref:Ras GEF n=1 Tax=[Candida] arabinofermentans NRRL YB-2248 TaxID=983967 RepID=A0A1E4STL6_9ASCO|nr:hypothetical protein CANARDRAFT_10144 [[Candida] arabinofermentans NRRL YB-2248]
MTDEMDDTFNTIHSDNELITVNPLCTVIVKKFLNNENNPSILNLIVDDIIYVLSMSNPQWWDGIIVDPIGNITRGWFPPSFTKIINWSSNLDQLQLEQLEKIKFDEIQKRQQQHHQTSVSTLKNEFNHFESKNNSIASSSISGVSSLQQPITPVKQLQQPQPQPQHTEFHTSSFHLTTQEEIDLYFQPSNSSSQPNFNFIPIWIPQITQDDELLYYNPTLNIYSKDLPLINSEYIDPNTKLEYLDVSKINGVETIPLSYKEMSSNQGSERNFNDSQQQQQQQQQQQHQQLNTAQQPQQPHIPILNRDTIVEYMRNNESSLIYNPNLFYYDPSDLTNWNELNSSFVFLMNMSIDALFKNSKQLFMAHLNSLSTLTVLYQLISKLLIKDLIENQVDNQVKKLLQKTTSSLIQFTINGNLHLTGKKDAPNYLGGLMNDSSADDENSNESESTTSFEERGRSYSENNSIYLKQAERDGAKLIKRTIDLFKIFTNLKLISGLNPMLLPLTYPRFFKNKFNAGNFTNQFDDIDNLNEADLFIDGQNNKSNILLDDEVIGNLNKYQLKTNKILEDVLQVLITPSPKDIQMETFLEERNLNILTLVFNCVPSINKFIDIIESIDFTIFIMINKLSKNSNKDRNLTLVDDLNINNDDEIQDLKNQQFYEATSKSINPLLIEFLTLKQKIHSIFSELIIDSQNLTVDDPEVFKGLKEEQVIYNKEHEQLKSEQFAKIISLKIEEYDYQQLNEGLYLYDSSLKLRSTITKIFELFSLIILSTNQLKEERQSILNYCSRLMNSDFNIASLFIAERHNTMVSSLSQSEYYFERKKSDVDDELNEIPWFLDIEDDEKSMLYDSNGLKGGSIEGIIAKLVNPLNKLDLDFENSVLMFFTTFMTPLELLNKLTSKFNISIPEALSYEEYGIWLSKKLQPQQSKIIEIFKKLFSTYWHVNYSSMEFKQGWEDFTNDNIILDDELIQLGFHVIDITTQEEYFKEFGDGNPQPIKHNERPPIPLALGKNLMNIKKIRLKEIDSMELARQITLIQFELFNKINKMELMSRSYNFNKIFNKKDSISSKNISNFIENCNLLTHFTIFMILKQKDLNNRADLIKYFIIVSEKLIKLKNFSSMTAIISGLGSTSISRLKKTWELIPRHLMTNFNKMDNLMSIGKNYGEYRSILKFIDEENEPCLPFLGMYLSDLRFLTDGNSDNLQNNKKLINISKRINIYKSIKEVIKFNSKNYNFEKIDEIWLYLKNIWEILPNDEKLYEISLKLEPRVSLLKQQSNLVDVPNNRISTVTQHHDNISHISHNKRSVVSTVASIASNAGNSVASPYMPPQQQQKKK